MQSTSSVGAIWKKAGAGSHWRAEGGWPRSPIIAMARARKTVSRSRGLLVSEFVLSREHPRDFLHELQIDADLYDGFNLIVADRGQVWHFNNVSRQIARVAPGVHGLSNHLLDTPWPKVGQRQERHGERTVRTKRGFGLALVRCAA